MKPLHLRLPLPQATIQLERGGGCDVEGLT